MTMITITRIFSFPLFRTGILPPVASSISISSASHNPSLPSHPPACVCHNTKPPLKNYCCACVWCKEEVAGEVFVFYIVQRFLHTCRYRLNMYYSQVCVFRRVIGRSQQVEHVLEMAIFSVLGFTQDNSWHRWGSRAAP